MIFRWALLLAGVKWRAGLSQIGLEHDINHHITLIASDMIDIDMNTITVIIPNLLILWICRLRYVELNIVPNISCVANLGLVDIQVTLLGCQVDHHVQLYPFRSLKRWFALFEAQQVWEQFYL